MATYRLNDAGVEHARKLDFSRTFRQGLVAAEQRAAQNDDDDIAKAAEQLLEHPDDKLGTRQG